MDSGVGHFPSSKFFRKNKHLHDLRSGLLLYRATAEAAESLKAQLHSKGKLTTLRPENPKISEFHLFRKNILLWR
jgi:hypothetical protein